jgi:hypothetical protein
MVRGAGFAGNRRGFVGVSVARFEMDEGALWALSCL